MYVLECWQIKACGKPWLVFFFRKNKTRQLSHWFWSTVQLWDWSFFWIQRAFMSFASSTRSKMAFCWAVIALFCSRHRLLYPASKIRSKQQKHFWSDPCKWLLELCLWLRKLYGHRKRFEYFNVMRNETLLYFSHTGDADNFSKYVKRKFKGNIYTIINLPKSNPTKAGYELKLRFSPFLAHCNYWPKQ